MLELELRDDKGLIGTIKLSDEKLTELGEALGLGSALTEAKASLSEAVGLLNVKGDELAQTTAELAELREHSIDSRDPTAIGQVMIDFGSKLSEVGFKALAKKTGHEVLLKEEVPAEESQDGTVLFVGEPEDPENWELMAAISAFIGKRVYKKK